MKYSVLEKSFINGGLAQEGDIVEYNGKPGSNLELIKEAAKVETASGLDPSTRSPKQKQ